MQFEPSTDSIGAALTKKLLNWTALAENFKFGAGKVMEGGKQIRSSAHRTMQLELPTNSISAILGEIWQIPLPRDHQGCAGHFEKSANGPEMRNMEQMKAH